MRAAHLVKPSPIVRIMNTQKIVTTSIKAKSGHVIYVKKSSEPEKEVIQIYRALNYRDRPFWQKKFVLPVTGKQKKEVIDTGDFFELGRKLGYDI